MVMGSNSEVYAAPWQQREYLTNNIVYFCAHDTGMHLGLPNFSTTKANSFARDGHILYKGELLSMYVRFDATDLH